MIVVDTDVGYDDVMAIAMLLAAGAPVVGMTTVNGLADALQGARNLLSLVERVGRRDSLVAVGAALPLRGNRSFKPQWQRYANALAGIQLPPTDLTLGRERACEYLVRIVAERPAEITLLCLGPLTNVALAIERGGDRFVRGIREVVIMGGAVRVPGNHTPNGVAEWNFYVNPLAADRTLRSGLPITLIGLDATNDAPSTPELLDALCTRESGHAAGQIMQEAMRHMYDYLYDQVAAAYLLDRSIVETARLPIRVVSRGRNAGQTVEDPSGTPIEVALGLKAERFRELLLELLA